MRTNIEIDDGLMKAAKRAAGLKTKKATVEAALRLLLKLRRQAAVGRLYGTVAWRGDVDSWRRDRNAGGRSRPG